MFLVLLVRLRVVLYNFLFLRKYNNGRTHQTNTLRCSLSPRLFENVAETSLLRIGFFRISDRLPPDFSISPFSPAPFPGFLSVALLKEPLRRRELSRHKHIFVRIQAWWLKWRSLPLFEVGSRLIGGQNVGTSPGSWSEVGNFRETRDTRDKITVLHWSKCSRPCSSSGPNGKFEYPGFEITGHHCT